MATSLTRKDMQTGRVLLTFDYELFFGRSGSPQKCLFEPANALLSYLKNINICATFFVDVLYLMRIKEEDQARADLLTIRQQLQKLVLHGHRIELHLHPHWIDAEYKNGNWIFPHYQHYRLQSLSRQIIKEIFVKGTSELENIAQEVVPGYKITAFRAGGGVFNLFVILLRVSGRPVYVSMLALRPV